MTNAGYSYPTCPGCGTRVFLIVNAAACYRLRVTPDGKLDMGGRVDTWYDDMRWNPYCEEACGVQLEFEDFGDEATFGFGGQV